MPQIFRRLITVLSLAASANAQREIPPGSRNKPERLEWFRDLGFGMFIHRSQDRPEQPIQRVQLRLWLLLFQDGDLLAQREDFESNIRTASEEATSRGDQGQEKRNHGLIVYDPRTVKILHAARQ